MWFFRQAQQIPVTPQREVERVEERIEPRREASTMTRQQEARVQPQQMPQEHHAHPHGREAVHAVERVTQTAERAAEQVVSHAAPAADWFVDIVRPLERQTEEVVHDRVEHFMDGHSWMKAEG